MKDLLEKYFIRLLSLITILTFTINTIFLFKQKSQAQNEFMENSLSFLFYEIKDKDRIDLLDDFIEKNPTYDILMFDKDKEILFRSNESLDTSYVGAEMDEKIRKIDYYIKDSLNTGFYIGGAFTLLIKSKNTISDFLSIKLISIYLLSYLLFVGIGKFMINNFTDQFVKGLVRFNESYNYKIIDPKYEEVKPYFKDLAYKNKNLRRDVEKNKERWQDLMTITENMEEGLIILGSDGNIEIMNKSSKNLLAKDENANLENLIDDESYRLSIREIKINQRPKTLEHRLGESYLKIIIDPITNNHSKGYVVIIIDNSENKRAEILRREFSSNVSHELKSPLTSINGYAELIATGMAKDEDIKDFAQIIYKEGNRLLEIIDDIIKLSSLDEANKEIKKEEIDIKDVANNAILKFKNKTTDKNITTVNNIASYNIKTSPSLFYDLFTNIYENAIKYTNPNGKIELSSLIMDKKLYILIKDNGIGISQKDQARIFERFFIADKARRREEKSTGLGLSIAKHIADYLDLNLLVSSELGKGSTFKIVVDI